MCCVCMGGARESDCIDILGALSGLRKAACFLARRLQAQSIEMACRMDQLLVAKQDLQLARIISDHRKVLHFLWKS